MSRAIIREKLKTQVGVIVVDSCIDETHTLSNTVTDHPVETGFNVTDHSRPDPDTVQLRCFISNTPLSTTQVTNAVRQGSVNFETTAPEFIEGLADNAFKQLKKYRDEGTLLQVVTSLRTYALTDTEGMMIQTISIPRTSKNYDGLEFSITLKQIRIVKNRSSQQKKPKVKKTQKIEDKGDTPTEPVEERTLLLQELNAFGVLK